MTNVLPLRRERGPSAVHTIQYSDKLAWIGKVATDLELTPSDLRIAVVLSGYINTQDGRAWPSHATLAETTGLNERTVTRGLKALVARGYLSLEKGNGRGRCNVYTFQPVDADVAPLPTDGAAPVEASEKGDKSYREPERKGDKSYRERVTNPAGKGDKNSPLTRISNINKKTKGAGTREALPERCKPAPGPSKPKPLPEPKARFVPTDDPRFAALAAIHERLRGKPPFVLPANLAPGGKAGYSFALDVFDELDRQAFAALPDGWEGAN